MSSFWKALLVTLILSLRGLLAAPLEAHLMAQYPQAAERVTWTFRPVPAPRMEIVTGWVRVQV